MIIKSIIVNNFRSIVHESIDLSNLSILVGKNDVGKSNVLKSLNLFFNHETDYDKRLDFDQDYSHYAAFRNKKAKEISVELIIQAPGNYLNAQDIRWKKVWRKNFIHAEEISFVDGTSFPARSKLYYWLENIRFMYVPAVKDQKFFELLLGKLHDSLAETISNELREAGSDFISKIRNNTSDLIQEISSRLGLTSVLNLPTNLQVLFKTLDFTITEGDDLISLQNRGDGLKTRHIPVILKFIAEQYNVNRTKGSPNVNVIWAYEEPENNLELLTAYSLASDFIDYSQNVQILLTTHSPAFYSLKLDHSNYVSLYSVSKNSGEKARLKIIEDYRSLDVDMGVMPLIAPYLNDRINEVLTLQKEIESFKVKFESLNHHCFFVEGNDEVIVFNKIFETLGKVNVKVSNEGFGCTGVRDQIMAMSWIASTINYKGIGLFDSDPSGASQYKNVQDQEQFKTANSAGKVKIIKYDCPIHMRNVVSKLMGFPIELEEMYSLESWQYAASKEWLEERPIEELKSLVNVDSANQTILDKLEQLAFTESEKLIVLNKVKDSKKNNFAKYVIKDVNRIQALNDFCVKKVGAFFD